MAVIICEIEKRKLVERMLEKRGYKSVSKLIEHDELVKIIVEGNGSDLERPFQDHVVSLWRGEE